MVPEVVQPIWLNQIHFVLRTPDKVNSLPDFAPDFLDCIFRASIAQQPFYSPAFSLVFSLRDSKDHSTAKGAEDFAEVRKGFPRRLGFITGAS